VAGVLVFALASKRLIACLVIMLVAEIIFFSGRKMK